MGDGPIPAEVMVVGEAPGEREDERHRAFVGPAGKLLDEVLADSGLSRDGVYITNVAKCRPPGNRTPTRTELKTCAEEYLTQEIEAVGPDYVLLLGNSALQAVVRKSGITKHRGKVWTNEERSFFATYHPAAALRNPRLHPELRADINRFGRLVRGEASEVRTSTRIVRTLSQLKWLRRQLMKAKVISFDIETYVSVNGHSNLEDWHGEKSKIVSIGFSWDEGSSAVVPLDHGATPWGDPYRALRYLGDAFRRGDCRYVAHNGKYDCRWLARKGIFVPMSFDTMLAAHMLDENRPKGLKSLSQVILGADAYDVGDELGDAYSMPIRRLCKYNAKDTDYTLRLYNVFKLQLKEEPRSARVFMKLMMPASDALTRVERCGIYMDKEKWDKAFELARSNEYKLRTFMHKYVPKREVEVGTDGDTVKVDAINFASPQQLAWWLFDYLDLPVIETTAKGHRSTKESVLLRLAKQHPAAKALIKWRKWTKYRNTYLFPWKEWADDRSRIHPTYRLFGTVTGRLSCVDPNLQQVPRDPLLRGIFGAAPGWQFVEADYSQVELRIAAMLANERRMLRRFLNGEDIHLATAVEMTGKLPTEISSEERKKAKAVNFGFLYGMGAKKFVEYALDNYDVEVSLGEATKTRDRFFESYPALRPWHDRQRRLANRYGRVASPIGRIRHLPDVQSRDKEVRAEAERQAINSPVQSMASDLMLLSLLRLDESLPNNRARVVGSVHDSLLLEVREDDVEEVVPHIRSTMEDMGPVKRKFGYDVSVPIEVEIKVGQHWGEGRVVER